MKFFKAIHCTTSLPKNCVERDEDYVEIGGEGAARVIGDILTSAGMSVTPPELEEEHGWYFDIEKDRRSYWMMVTHLGDRLYITTNGPSPFWDKVCGQRHDYPAFMDALYDLLSKDERFSDLTWNTDPPYVGRY